MNKIYLKPAIATLGILASTCLIEGQTAAGGGAGTTATAPAGRAPVTAPTRPGTSTPQAAPQTGLNTIGAAAINQPPATPPIGATSILETPNNLAGGPAGATLPGVGLAPNQQPIAVTSLPAGVQRVLSPFSASGALGTVSQIQGVNGSVYRAQVIQNGAPVELQIAQTGQILSRTPVTGTAGPITAANNTATTLGNVQAGLPVSSLPLPVQNSLQTQLGVNGQVQTISRDDLANGTVFRVTALQNGTPTELRFGANGTLLSSAPLNGPNTSAFTGAGGTIVPAIGTSMVLSELPIPAQGSIRTQVGNGRLNQITQQQGTNGLAYLVSYDSNGRPMMMVVGPDGRVQSNLPVGIGAAATGASGRGASTNSTTRTNNTTRTSMKLEELPDPVLETLKREAQYAEARSIIREQRVGGDIYTVNLRGENTVGEISIGSDGQIVSDSRRNLSDLSIPKTTPDESRVTGIPLSKVPGAIQDAIKAYATASNVRSVTLGSDRDGKAVYQVVVYRDGRRDQLIIAKDGTIRRIDENVSPLVEAPDPTKEPILALGDLPQQVQDTIRRQTQNVLIKEIQTKRLGAETVYQVRYNTNGAPVELLVAKDGSVVLPRGLSDNGLGQAPTPAGITEDERPSAKVVDANNTSLTPAQNAGVSATTERGSVNSSVVDLPQSEKPATKLNLSDVPVPVQNTAKKLAGTATIDSIIPKLKDSGIAYEVEFMQDGNRKTVLINKDGVVRER